MMRIAIDDEHVFIFAIAGLFGGMSQQLRCIEFINGDAAADWAKLCQSVLGFDEVVFGLPRAPRAYRARLLRALAGALRGVGADPRAVLDVCVCLVAGSLHAYEDARVRDGLWELVTRALWPGGSEEWEELVGIMHGEC
jgi:hypothetical protein